MLFQWVRLYTYLFLLLVEIINNDTDEKVEREERAEDDEEHEVEVHVDVDLADRLLTELQKEVKELTMGVEIIHQRANGLMNEINRY